MAWYDGIIELGTAAVDNWSTVKEANAPATPAPAAAPGLPKWLIPVLIGVGVLILVLGVFSLGRK